MKWTHKGTIAARFVLILFSGFRGEGLNVKVYDDDGHQVMVKAHMAFVQVNKQTHTAPIKSKHHFGVRHVIYRNYYYFNNV